MLYPENFEEKIGFETIRNWLSDFCNTSAGELLINELKFSTNAAQIFDWQEETKAFRKLLDEEWRHPSGLFQDIRPLLKKMAITNAFLSTEEFADLHEVCKLVDGWQVFFENDEEKAFSRLASHSSNFDWPDNLPSWIESIIDLNEMRVKDNASVELKRIRREIQNIESKVRRSMQRVYKEALDKGYVHEKADLTIRNGRLVIPIAAENKRAIKGYIHDQSATGQTVFLEPGEIFEMNNGLQDLQVEEHKEVVKILSNLTTRFRPYANDIEKGVEFLAFMDFTKAKAKLSIHIDASFPVISQKRVLKIDQARHPLLYVHHKSQNRPVIPLSLQINEQLRILVISGPNAGGKSVALKTVGLLVYMFQSGLPISLASGSTMRIFNTIFLDLGDEQSIENDLSTYSSHLTNMKAMLQAVDSNSLVLIDEFGTGTEPQFGGAIAEAILESFNQMGCKGIINTHYANLKNFAENREGMQNAAMLFDGKNLEPLYTLEVGKPGSSFAFEIAEKIGLPPLILKKAKSLVGYRQVDYDKLLSKLEGEKRELENLNKKLTAKDANLEKITQEYKDLKAKMQEERRNIIATARVEAAGIVKGANKRIEKTIREIREQQAEKETTQSVRKNLQEFLDNTQERIEPKPIAESKKTKKAKLKPKTFSGPINIGDWVLLKNSGAEAEVINVRDKEVEVLIGQIRSFVKLSQAEKIQKPLKSKRESAGIGISRSTYSMLDFSPNIDLRGKRAQEAIETLDKWLDKAFMNGIQELRILHGKGDGILREIIRKHLREYKQVKHIESEHVERGGDGITLVTLA